MRFANSFVDFDDAGWNAERRRAGGRRRMRSRARTMARTRCRCSSKLVIEAVNVKDKQGKSISGLTAKDFTVTEDGMAQKVTFCEYQELPTAPPAPPAKPAPENIKVYNRLAVTQIAAEKPGDVQLQRQAADCDVLRPDGDAAGGQAAGAGGGAEVYPDADDVGGPGVDHALWRQLGGCAAGLYRRPQQAAEHSGDADRRRESADG